MSLPESIKPDTDKEPAEKAETNSASINTIRELLESPEILEKLAAFRKYRRPPEVSRNTIYSYYREIFALEIKVSIDRMLETKKDMEWPFSLYPSHRPSSLYQRVYQSLRYLIDFLDDSTGKYKTFRSMVILTKEKTGIRLSWIRDKLDGRPFEAVEVKDQLKTNEWKEQVETFLEDDTKNILHLKKLALTTEQVTDLQQSFHGIEGIAALITEREIKIIKLNSKPIEETGQGYDC